MLTATVAESVFLYAIDNDCYCVHQKMIVTQLDEITKNTQKYLQKTPTREFVKQGSAFITEGVLFSKICTFAHTAAKQLKPLVKNYVEYIAKQEPAALFGDGAVYVENITEQLLPRKVFDKIKSVGSQKLKPLGRGSTGRTVPNNLHEKLVMEQIMASPREGLVINVDMTDIRWHKDDGWVKMCWHNDGIEVHYVAQIKNGVITAIDDFKFKDNLARNS